MHVADPLDREDGALDPQQERPEVGGVLLIEIGEVDVRPRLEQPDER
jgi:hypothetical protein